MRGKVCVYVCVSQAGRDRKGRARWSHRVRTEVVLTALKGKMPHKRAGRWLPTRAHSSHKQQQQQQPSSPIWTWSFGTRSGGTPGGEGGDEVSVQAYWPTRWRELWNWPQDTKGEKGGGALIKWPDCASTRLCFVTTEQSGGGPQSQGVGRGGCSCRKGPGCGWGFLCWGRDLVLATVPHPWRHNRVPWEVSRARRTCEFEASEESLFQGRMHSRPPLAPVPCSQCILKDPEPSWPLDLPQCKLHTWGHLLPAPH